MSENKKSENKRLEWRQDQSGVYTVAYMGDTVTCPNGHEICTVGKDISFSRMLPQFEIALFNFRRHQGPPNPQARKDSEGLPIARCGICHELWIQHSVELQVDYRLPRQGMMLCVQGEWR